MFGFVSNSDNPLNQLYFAEPQSISQEIFNEMLDLVRELEKDEEKWESILGSEEEKGRMDVSRIEQLNVKIEKKHKRFEESLEKFRQKVDSERQNAPSTKDEKEISKIEVVLEDLEARASKLDNYVEKTNTAIEKGDASKISQLIEIIEEDRQRTIEELRELGKQIS